MKKALSFIVLLSIALAFVKCKKDKVIPPQNRFASQDVYNYAFFRQGSYWIFQDSVSLVEDSVFVTESKWGFDTLENSSGSKSLFEYFYVKLHSTLENYDYYLSFGAHYNSQGDFSEKVLYDKFNPGDTSKQLLLFELPAKKNHIHVWNQTQLTIDTVYDSVFVFQDTLLSVIQVSQLNDLHHQNQQSTYFIAKYKGIVRKEFHQTGKVWKMVRYRLEQ